MAQLIDVNSNPLIIGDIVNFYINNSTVRVGFISNITETAVSELNQRIHRAVGTYDIIEISYVNARCTETKLTGITAVPYLATVKYEKYKKLLISWNKLNTCLWKLSIENIPFADFTAHCNSLPPEYRIVFDYTEDRFIYGAKHQQLNFGMRELLITSANDARIKK